jgi:prolyl-tRNA editing enzyme YbaK/EbsC (Cys-tRNA(Pro) deacylase)
MDKLSSSAQKVQEALRQAGFSNQVIEHEATTRTAKEAAAAVGCTVGQIVKSLIFRGKQSGEPILVLASGPNRVDENLLGQAAGEQVEKPDANFVLAQTGFVIGGVPPLGHTRLLVTFIDQDLLGYDEIWAAAGTPNAVFRLTPAELQLMAPGKVIQISKPG